MLTVKLRVYLAGPVDGVARLERYDPVHISVANNIPVVPLTEREEDVLITVARGLTNSEIAHELHISLSTVKTHLTALMNKLGARNRVELAMWAYETGRIKN